MSSNANSFGISAITRVFSDSSSDVRSRVVSIYTFLIALNIVAWVLAFVAFSRTPYLLGLAVIAYTFGLRHAVDADHISAIDNVTRKLMQEDKKPVAVGFFFSLGHSTIVVALTVAIAIAATLIKNTIPAFQSVGALVGTSVSALFLLLIAAINLIVLIDIFKAFRAVSRGGEYDNLTIDETLNQRGLMGRFFRPLLKVVGNSWNMYPIGVLFGLGFDTATEVGLLGIVGLQAGKGLPIVSILIFPLLFLAGMCLLDTTDGVLMLGAYGWAFEKPLRKLFYNLNITFISVMVALIVGAIEVLSVVQSQMNLQGSFWDMIGNLSNNFGVIGGVIIGLFILSWVISTIIYKVKGYDDLEVKQKVEKVELDTSIVQEDEKRETAASHYNQQPVRLRL